MLDHFQALLFRFVLIHHNSEHHHKDNHPLSVLFDIRHKSEKQTCCKKDMSVGKDTEHDMLVITTHKPHTGEEEQRKKMKTKTKREEEAAF